MGHEQICWPAAKLPQQLLQTCSFALFLSIATEALGASLLLRYIVHDSEWKG